MTPAEFGSRDTFLVRAQSALLREPEGPRRAGAPVLGDHRLPGFDPDPERLATAVGAAVLVPVTFRADGGSIILTERSSKLRKHSGQVAFPGGRIDAGETPLEAALREAEEEIALSRKAVEPIGYLPSYYTGTGYRITPTVALVDPDTALTPNPEEVERVFEVPLDVLFDMARYRLESRVWEGRERRYYVVDHPDAYIWGATAALIRILYERLSQA
jgi:8-oxo-dGTP pyrophosphatase MutT (NUDIX family)